MRASDITRQKIVEATADLGGGDTITFQFDRNRITPAWVEEATRRDEDRDPLALARTLAEMVAEWDVTNDDGTVFAPTVENLATFPFDILSKLVTRMVEAAAPSEAEGKASAEAYSSAPSTFTAPEATSPNGEAPSPSPSVSASPSPT